MSAERAINVSEIASVIAHNRFERSHDSPAFVDCVAASHFCFSNAASAIMAPTTPSTKVHMISGYAFIFNRQFSLEGVHRDTGVERRSETRAQPRCSSARHPRTRRYREGRDGGVIQSDPGGATAASYFGSCLFSSIVNRVSLSTAQSRATTHTAVSHFSLAPRISGWRTRS